MKSSRDTTAAGELFGTRLREIRLKRGLSQQALAERLGVAQTQISGMEVGIKVPNLFTVLRLAVALECKVTELVSVFDRTDLRSLLAE